MTHYVTPDTSYNEFVFMRIIQVIGLPFLFVPISTLAFKDVPREKSNKASAVFAMSRNLGGSIGIALIESFVVRHQQVEQAYLVGNLSDANPVYHANLAGYAQTIFSHGHTLASSMGIATGRMYRELLQQSEIMAFCDAFALMATVMGTLAFVAFLMPHNDPHAKKSAAAATAH